VPPLHAPLAVGGVARGGGGRGKGCGYYRGQSKAERRGFEAGWCMSFTIRNGQIGKFREYTDTAAIAAAYQMRSAAYGALGSVDGRAILPSG